MEDKCDISLKENKVKSLCYTLNKSNLGEKKVIDTIQVI
jgi:hypothetical protein